jgi:hypothetical protein
MVTFFRFRRVQMRNRIEAHRDRSVLCTVIIGVTDELSLPVGVQLALKEGKPRPLSVRTAEENQPPLHWSRLRP